MYTIYLHINSSQIIYESISANTLREAVVEVVAKRTSLSGANLSRANLSEASLSGANFAEANLYEADLSGANLPGANLYEANLAEANLSGANLYEADLSGANLYEADLSGANLSGANLSGASLSRANLSGANLSGVNLLFLPLSPWIVIITPTRTHIGCQLHTNERWLSWSPEDGEIKKMHPGASKYWQGNQEEIKRNIREVMDMVSAVTNKDKEN